MDRGGAFMKPKREAPPAREAVVRIPEPRHIHSARQQSGTAPIPACSSPGCSQRKMSSRIRAWDGTKRCRCFEVARRFERTRRVAPSIARQQYVSTGVLRQADDRGAPILVETISNGDPGLLRRGHHGFGGERARFIGSAREDDDASRPDLFAASRTVIRIESKTRFRRPGPRSGSGGALRHGRRSIHRSMVVAAERVDSDRIGRGRAPSEIGERILGLRQITIHLAAGVHVKIHTDPCEPGTEFSLVFHKLNTF